MNPPTALLLTDDPAIASTAARLADESGAPLRTPGSTTAAGPPGLVLLGADRLAHPGLPSEALGVPVVLLVIGQPPDSLWRDALEQRVEQVLLLPAAEYALLERLQRLRAPTPAPSALTIAVAGGCGGAGASMLAAALARAATPLARTLLIEVDQLGGGADLLLGAEDEPGLRWPDLLSVRSRMLPGSLRGAVPVVDGLHVLSWDRSADLAAVPQSTAEAVLEAAVTEFGVVVLDLPRQLDAAGVVAATWSDVALLVVPAEVRAAAAARRVAAGLAARLADLRLVVRVPGPTGLTAEAVADALQLPLAGALRPEPGARAALDRGEPPGLRARGPLGSFCRHLLDAELEPRGTEFSTRARRRSRSR